MSNLIKIKLKKTINLRFKEITHHKLELKIELNQAQDVITYKSYLVWQLARLLELDSLQIADNIVNIFNQLAPDISAQVSQNGWLEFTITERLLYDWLKQLPLIRFPPLPQPKNQQNYSFNLYYTHARFCSILKSAHQQKIIILNNLQFQLNQWHIENYEQLPYYALSSPTNYEYKLIKQLVIITELLKNQHNKINYFNNLINLSKVMLEFESHCRIWGKVKQENPKLSQARLGLMALALHYYQNLVDAQLKIKLPTEL